MNRTPDTIEDLREFGLKLLARAREELSTTGALEAAIFLADAADGSENRSVGVHPSVLQSNESKTGLSKVIHSLIKEHGYFHVATMFDCHFIRDKDEDERKLIEKMQATGANYRAITEAGVGTIQELIMVNVETPEHCVQIVQEYVINNSEKSVVFGEISEKLDQPDPHARFKVFDQPPAPAKSDVLDKLKDALTEDPIQRAADER
jgi:hypothetical protein